MRKFLIISLALVLSACGTTNNKNTKSPNSDIYNQSYATGTLTTEQQSELMIFSMSLMDTKYNWGGKKPDFGLDCSGLISHLFKKSLNINLRGAARDIVKYGRSVPLSHAKNQKLEIGDLLFFNTTGKPYSHVGMYIGKNQFLHSSSGAGKVIVSSVFSKYYINRLEEIKRI